MLKSYDVFNSLLNSLKDKFANTSDPLPDGKYNWLKSASMYKAELEEGREWKSVFPSLFIEVIREEITRTASQKAYNNDITVNLFIADKNTDSPSVLQRVDDIRDFLNGYLLPVRTSFAKVHYQGYQLHAYIHGGPCAYLLTFKILQT